MRDLDNKLKNDNNAWSSQNRAMIREVLEGVQDRVIVTENDIDKIIRLHNHGKN